MLVYVVALTFCVSQTFTVFLDRAHLDSLSPATQIAPHNLSRNVEWNVLEPVLLLLLALDHRLVLTADLRKVNRLFVGLLDQRYVDVLSVGEAYEVLFLN